MVKKKKEAKKEALLLTSF